MTLFFCFPSRPCGFDTFLEPVELCSELDRDLLLHSLLFCFQRTGYWGCRRYPVICGLTTTSNDGKKLLQGRPGGTFLLRVSSVPGALVVMYVKHHQQVRGVYSLWWMEVVAFVWLLLCVHLWGARDNFYKFMTSTKLTGVC